MRGQRHVLAIDLGTSGPKVAVVDATGRTPGTARASVDTLTQPGGIAEQDPHQIWEAVKSAAARALAGSGVGREDIVAVICSSQYSSIVPVDREGQPTSTMILWQDHRGTKKDLKGTPGFPAVPTTPWSSCAGFGSTACRPSPMACPWRTCATSSSPAPTCTRARRGSSSPWTT